jgi:hypothetical protein
VERALGKDVQPKFSLPILQKTVHKILGAMAQPLGMAKQLTPLTKSGDQVPKFLLTRDLLFSLTTKKALVNSWIDLDAYAKMKYRWCLVQTIHYIALC